MKKKSSILILLVILMSIAILTGFGVTFAYYQVNISGAVTNRTANYAGEVEVVSETHTITPASNVAVDEIKFYVKNYTGSDSEPTLANESEVYMSYTLALAFPSWGSGCTNPISYRLYSVDESNNNETEVTLNNNTTSAIDFDLLTAERDYYKLKLYWNMTYNSVSCYAGKSGNVGITANIYQRNV